MIKIPINVAHVSGGTGPFTFTFTSTNTNVSFSNPSGTVPLISGTYIASTDVIYANQSDIGVGTVSCSFLDTSTGCSKILSPITISNPCTLQSTISNSGEFIFVATTTGGSGSYVYEWNYDSDLFEPNADTNLSDNILSLKIKKVSLPPMSSLITVLITDGNGCTLQKNYTYSFCYPTIQNATIALNCSDSTIRGCGLTTVKSSYINYDLKPLISVCSGQVIDWTKLSFSTPSQICVMHNGNGIISIASNLSGISSNITYTIVTETQLQKSGTLTVSSPVCTQKTPFNGVPTTVQLIAGNVIGTTRLLPVEPRIAGTPNWSTFTFTNTPTWGTVVLNANREIAYTITNIATTPTIPDVIKWSLNDYLGNQINITDTILRDILPVPTTVTEVVCSSCGMTVGPIDLLANDTGSIDRSTVQIVLNDPDIVITKDSDNNFIFTSLLGASLNNLCSYKVANIQGVYAPNQNFFVRSVCVGNNKNPTLDLTCTVSKVFDIKDSFVTGYSFGDVYLETTPALPTYASQGGVITGAEGTVTLTGLVNKTYTFQYTAQNQGACSPTYDDIGTLTVVHGVTPFINFGTAVNNGNGTSTYPFTYSGAVSSFAVTLNGNPATFQSGIVANNGSGTFTLYNVAGLNTCVIATTSICGVAINDTDATLTI